MLFIKTYYFVIKNSTSASKCNFSLFFSQIGVRFLSMSLTLGTRCTANPARNGIHTSSPAVRQGLGSIFHAAVGFNAQHHNIAWGGHQLTRSIEKLCITYKCNGHPITHSPDGKEIGPQQRELLLALILKQGDVLTDGEIRVISPGLGIKSQVSRLNQAINTTLQTSKIIYIARIANGYRLNPLPQFCANDMPALRLEIY